MSAIVKLIIIIALAGVMTFVKADVINIRADAPQTYVVKKGDTLWDISSVFLEQPWLWPELWRNNTQIENPHLIYPGDVLKLRYIDGVPTFELVSDKKRIALSPDTKVVLKAKAIDVLPWKRIAPYVANDTLMSEEDYAALPHLLGDVMGTPGFVTNDFVLSHKNMQSQDRYDVVRKQRKVQDSMGKVLGFQADHIAQAKTLQDNRHRQRQHLVRIESSKSEARPGDKLKPVDKAWMEDMELIAADSQRGELVGNVNGRKLVGKQDVVIINLGERFVSPGTVMGVYVQGPAIYDGEQPEYEKEKSAAKAYFSYDTRIEQPALKIGEIVVFKSFEHASYAWVSSANTYFQGGEIVAHP